MFESQFQLPSFAKINWILRVLRRRADGYHEVETVLQTISLKDTLYFSPSSSGEVTLVCDAPGIPTGDDNLIIRAARTLKERSGVKAGARIFLEKCIPTRAGLGGASSNAAVSLLGLLKLWQLEVSSEELNGIGAQLGADVPFFFHGGCAFATGTGTSIRNLPDSQKELLLVIVPGVEVATADAYKALDSAALTTKVPETILSISRAPVDIVESDLRLRRDSLHNDFEQVIFDIEPEIERASEALTATGAKGVLMAGSGSSIFGIFENQKARQGALDQLQCEASWKIFSCETLSREEYLLALSSCSTPLLRSFNRGSDTGA